MARTALLSPTSAALWKTCAHIVEGLWTFTARKEKLRRLLSEKTGATHTGADSYGASLARIAPVRDNRRAAVTQVTSSSTLVRYKETINGRAYVIEASSVGRDRWRAQIARLPGGRAALMPFYGATPDEAAGQLSAWLTRASRTQ